MLGKELDARVGSISEVNAGIESYFKQRNETVTRNAIGKFVKSPDEHFKSLVEEKKAKHLERAIFFQKQGGTRIDDAISEFSKVLHLDPKDKKAQEHLEELRKRQSHRKAESPRAVRKGKRSKIPPIAIFAPVLAAVIVIGFFVIPGFFEKPAVPAFGWASIDSDPSGASVLIDDIDRGITPLLLGSMPKNEYSLQLVKKEYDNYQGNFVVEPGNTTSVRIALVRSIIPVKFGKIDIRSNPSGALVYIDNVNTKSRTPCVIDSITEGSHRFRLIRDGYEIMDIVRTVDANSMLKVNVTLNRIATQPVPEIKYGYLRVRVDPWAKIYIDDSYVETTPIARPLKIAAGTHRLKLENPSYKPWQRNISIVANDTASIDAKLEPRDGSLKLTVKPWADVYIDGKFYETTPIADPIRLSPGNHVLKLINPSFKPFEQTIQITADKILKKHVDLEPK